MALEAVGPRPILHRATPLRLTWLLRLPYPVRNMIRRWRSMIGMVIGVGIALGIVMTLSGVGRAVVEVYTIDFKRSSANLYVVTQGGKLIPFLPSDTPGTIKQASHELAQIRGMPGVQAALGIMNWTMEREREGPQRHDQPAELIATMGVDGDPEQIPGSLGLRQGRWIRRSNEIVLGPKLAQDKGLGIGSSIRLNGRDFTVVGLGRLRGFGFALDSVAFMDYRAFRQRVDIGDTLNIIAVSSTQPESTAEQIRRMASLSVSQTAEVVKQAEQALRTDLVTYYILDALALTIGALFVSSMLSRSVAERRAEFATLRAIGIPSRTILMTVAAEALMISVAAGIFGVGMSLSLGALLNFWYSQQYSLEFIYSADPPLFAQSFALAVGLGLVAGLLPARRATRVDPVEVLREA